ncbi:uncharacterized protein BDR25DRAFT_13109 [Lindgomyces ingoldianus]|uniref:Uncharacterized protein n=1 Tax=Lindgomyces ingoldianus TaxID=673940 RepID=A0ACB6R1S2_9PLEO|nr:uncharacterized protein BDR25DRAFT_13109 [Lindgomyces ingoldianus]KAF2472997.1 hypothetical protein BDR25DRAFT_13109 [Lindgomyces ingoldianus]
MILKTALLGGLLVASQASATVNALFQRGEDLEEQLRRDADSMVATLTRRQDTSNTNPDPQISSTPQSGDAAKADLAAWETQTKQACQNALTQLNGQASNPSGIAVCYNLPFLDNTTGVFQAELRMYNISAPIDPWVGVTAADVSMTLSYLGATVQSMNGTFMRREEVTWPPIRDGLLVERQTSAAPQELKVLNYVGKINPNLMGSAMTQATLQPLLIPKIELSAQSPKSNQQVSATLSSQEASFVNGVFSKQATTTNDPAAQASASAAVAKAAPFNLPGTNLAFFPTGLVITCIWTGGLFLAVGLGTVGRIQFREQYRRRMKREVASGMRTI